MTYLERQVAAGQNTAFVLAKLCQTKEVIQTGFALRKEARLAAKPVHEQGLADQLNAWEAAARRKLDVDLDALRAKYAKI